MPEVECKWNWNANYVTFPKSHIYSMLEVELKSKAIFINQLNRLFSCLNRPECPETYESSSNNSSVAKKSYSKWWVLSSSSSNDLKAVIPIVY